MAHRVADENFRRPSDRYGIVERVHIIGIGDDGLDGLTSGARALIEQADLIVGTQQSLNLLSDVKAATMLVGNDLDAVVERVAAETKSKIVVLAIGDPLFYGFARYLCDRLGKERFEVLPHVSSMQLAFARVKESWEDAYLANLATQSLDRVVEKVRVASTVGLFTTEECPPEKVAGALTQRKIDYFTAYVCENLGSPDERVTHAELSELADQQFSSLNVMILVRKPDVPDRPVEMAGRRLFGNADEAFLQSQPKSGLLTPAEVRCIALANMDLGPTSIAWDVGAGSGSVAIEAAQVAAGGTIYAIEQDEEDHQLIAENADRFGTTNLVAVRGRAPDAWGELPDPDAIFVGGADRETVHVVELAYDRLRPGGRLVAVMGSIENLAGIHEALHARNIDVQVRMINIAHGTYQLERVRFEALNPTFLIAVVKEGK